jgi:vacuolar-type H+-ATPase subunit H
VTSYEDINALEVSAYQVLNQISAVLGRIQATSKKADQIIQEAQEHARQGIRHAQKARYAMSRQDRASVAAHMMLSQRAIKCALQRFQDANTEVSACLEKNKEQKITTAADQICKIAQELGGNPRVLLPTRVRVDLDKERPGWLSEFQDALPSEWLAEYADDYTSYPCLTIVYVRAKSDPMMAHEVGWFCRIPSWKKILDRFSDHNEVAFFNIPKKDLTLVAAEIDQALAGTGWRCDLLHEIIPRERWDDTIEDDGTETIWVPVIYPGTSTDDAQEGEKP